MRTIAITMSVIVALAAPGFAAQRSNPTMVGTNTRIEPPQAPNFKILPKKLKFNVGDATSEYGGEQYASAASKKSDRCATCQKDN